MFFVLFLAVALVSSAFAATSADRDRSVEAAYVVQTYRTKINSYEADVRMRTVNEMQGRFSADYIVDEAVKAMREFHPSEREPHASFIISGAPVCMKDYICDVRLKWAKDLVESRLNGIHVEVQGVKDWMVFTLT